MVNTDERLLIYTGCEVPHLPKIVANHLKKAHGLPLIDSSVIKNLVDDYDLYKNVDDVINAWPQAICSPYKGIVVLDGFHCSVCTYASETPGAMRAHYQAHPGVSLKTSNKGKVQKIFMCSTFDKFLAVEDPLVDITTGGMYAIWYHSRPPPAPLSPPTEM